MTLADQRQIAAQLEELWRALMPDFGVPGEEQFLIWAGRDSVDVINLGINRAAIKRLSIHNTSPMTVDDVARYASGVIKNIRQGTTAQQSAQQSAGRRDVA
jgi:hypothetical protein